MVSNIRAADNWKCDEQKGESIEDEADQLFISWTTANEINLLSRIGTPNAEANESSSGSTGLPIPTLDIPESVVTPFRQ